VQTALQIYSASYKTLPPQDETFALLRKARRMDALVPAPAAGVARVAKVCRECGVGVSPRWYDDGASVSGGGGGGGMWDGPRKRKREDEVGSAVNGAVHEGGEGGGGMDVDVDGQKDIKPDVGRSRWTCHPCHLANEEREAETEGEGAMEVEAEAEAVE
jgi:hypothetical protein